MVFYDSFKYGVDECVEGCSWCDVVGGGVPFVGGVCFGDLDHFFSGDAAVFGLSGEGIYGGSCGECR